MNRIIAFFQLFQLGSQVADPAKWKSRQINANVISAFLLALVNAAPLFGVPLPFIVDPATVNALAVGFLSVVNSVLTLATSAKIGFVPDDMPAIKTTAIPGVVASSTVGVREPLPAAQVQKQLPLPEIDTGRANSWFNNDA